MRAAGFTLVELLASMSVLMLLAAMAVPQVLAGLDRSRAQAAARFLAGRMTMARAEAVAGAATVALRFGDGHHSFAVYVDGNGNGVRTRDIERGVDRLRERPADVAALFPGVVIASVGFGTSGLLSFTPDGTATSGTLAVRGRDGSQFGVRVYGVTGRTRVLRYNARTGTFEEGF